MISESVYDSSLWFSSLGFFPLKGFGNSQKTFFIFCARIGFLKWITYAEMMKTFIKSINRLKNYVLSIPKPNITPFDKLSLIYEKLKKKGVKFFGLLSLSIQSPGNT